MRRTIARSVLAASIFFAAVGAVPTSQASATYQALDPGLVATLADAESDASLMVFVHGETIDEAARAVDAAGLTLVERWARIGVAVASGTPGAIRRAAADPKVTTIEPNRAIEFALDTAHIASRAEEARDVSTGLFGPADLPYDGSGVSIAINDSGIDASHPMFMQDGVSKVVRNLRQMCPMSALGPPPCDMWVDVNNSDVGDGHGNLVAGVAAGFERVAQNGRTVRGAAPGAALVGLGSSVTPLALYGVYSGLNWVLENHLDPCGDGSCPPIKVVNNSWSSASDTTFNPEAAANKLSDQLVADGVVVVFSASNAGGDGSVNQVNAHAQNPTPGVIGVANYDDAGMGSRDNHLHPSSSRGLKTDPTTFPDLSAPGTDITSAMSASTRYYYREGDALVVDPHYGTTYGTSLSAPYVAGVAALLLEANPALTPAQIEYVLENTAHQFGTADYVADPRNPNHATSFDRGHGLIDVTAALASVLSRPAPEGPRCAGAGVVVDPEGDATSIIVSTGLPSAVSEKGLDITRAWVSTDPFNGALTFAVRLADLGELPPAGAPGEYLRFSFIYRGAPYEVGMERLGGASEVSVRFHLQTAGGATDRVIIADNLDGSFDHVADVVRAVVPADAFNAWDPALPAIGNGDALSGLGLVANRPYGSRPAGPAFLTADSAQGGCPHIVGS